jgi:transposase
MRILQVKPYLSDQHLKTMMNKQQTIRLFKDYQIIYSVQTNFGKKANEIAKILGITKNKVFKTVEKYNKYGLDWHSNKVWGGRREARCIMTFEEEVSFLHSLEEDSLKGQIIIYKQIKDKLEARVKRVVSDDYIWDLLKRHHWSKKVPRQTHPQSDKVVQEEFKKNSPNYWSPNR